MRTTGASFNSAARSICSFPKITATVPAFPPSSPASRATSNERRGKGPAPGIAGTEPRAGRAARGENRGILHPAGGGRPRGHQQDTGAHAAGKPAEQNGPVPRSLHQKRRNQTSRGVMLGGRAVMFEAKEHRDRQAEQRPRSPGAGQKARFLRSPRRALLHRRHIRRATDVQNPVDSLAQHEAAVRPELCHGAGPQGIRGTVWPGLYPGPAADIPTMDDIDQLSCASDVLTAFCGMSYGRSQRRTSGARPCAG